MQTFLPIALLALHNTRHEVAVTALRIESQHLLCTRQCLVEQVYTQLIAGLLSPQFRTVGFQCHKVIHVVDGELIAAQFHRQLRMSPQIRSSSLHIRTAEGAHGTVQQGDGRPFVPRLQLTLSSRIEDVSPPEVPLRQFLIDGISLLVLLLCIQNLSLLQTVDRLRVRLISQFRLFQSPLEAPLSIRLVTLEQFLLIDELCILVVRIILLLSHLHRLLHVLVRLGKLIGSHLHPCPVDIAVRSIRILSDETVDIVLILLRIHGRSPHEECQQGIVVFVRDGKRNVNGLERRITHAQSIGMQADGKRCTDGIAGSCLLVSSSLKQSDDLSGLVDDGTALLLFLSLQG